MAGSENNSAASLAANTSKAIKLENIGDMPGFASMGPKGDLDYSKYRVRYLKVDCDDIGSLAELELIETRGIQKKGREQQIVVLNKTGWSFMDKYLLLVTYLELIDER
jgi:hypothetical protein